MIRADARARVVLVNYNGGELLARAVRSALESQWPGPLDVVVVDNASTDGSLDSVRDLDDVHVIENATNEGFAANNHGFADLLAQPFALDVPEPDVVALLNPDAQLRPDALRRLAGALDTGRRIGAASPLIVFDRPFVECQVTVTSGDRLTIDGVRSGGDDVGSQCHGVDGAQRLPGEAGPLWLCPDGSTLRVPVVAVADRIELDIASGEGRIEGLDAIEGATVGFAAITQPSHRVIQNAGIRVDRWGTGHNRGFGKRLDEPRGPAAPLWCGAAVVFHADYLRDVGGFDPQFFLYYEDVDLGLRGLEAGWSTIHVEEAVVEHRHSDRSVQGTELVEVLQHRNRLLTQVRHGSNADIAKTFARAALTPVSLAVSAVANPGEARERLRLARWRARSVGQAARGVGEARAARKRHD